MNNLHFCSYQWPIFEDRHSGVIVLHWARQVGKSFTLAAWAVDRLRPGHRMSEQRRFSGRPGLLDRKAPEGSRRMVRTAGRPAEAGSIDDMALLVFRLGSEWLALALSVVSEVTMLRPVHRVPHRTNRVFSGLVSLRGQLQLCVSMHGLLDVNPPDPSLDPSLSPRLVVIRKDSETWAFPVDEVAGVSESR